jgi:hypothetical protein
MRSEVKVKILFGKAELTSKSEIEAMQPGEFGRTRGKK